jgi:hypothetical protein
MDLQEHSLSKHQALFEAWLTGGVPVSENGVYMVLSVDKVKKRIKELIEKENFTSAKELAERLKAEISFTEKGISRSVRVSFPIYAKLVNLSFQRNVELSTLIKTLVAEDVKGILHALSKRKDVKQDKVNFLEKTLKTWQLSLWKKKSIPKTYEPLTPFFPLMTKRLVELALDKALTEIRYECSDIPPEALERYFENIDIKKTIKVSQEEYPDLISVSLEPSKNNTFVIAVQFTLLLFFRTNANEYLAFRKEIRTEFGDDVVNHLEDAFNIDLGVIDEQLSDESLGSYLDVNILSLPLKVEHGVLRINDVVVTPSMKIQEDLKKKFLSQSKKNLERLKIQLNQALEREKFEDVAKISDRLVSLKRNYELTDYALGLISRLFRGKTQVVSFRAPEVIVRAWEAYGRTDLYQIMFLEKIENLDKGDSFE